VILCSGFKSWESFINAARNITEYLRKSFLNHSQTTVRLQVSSPSAQQGGFVYAVLSVVEQYEVILQSLYEMANSGPGKTAVKARGLHDQFSAGTTLLGLHIAMCVTAPLHELNRVLQARRETRTNVIDW
jgi:hypothetical protein